MRPGEWTKGEALALASGVEALELVARTHEEEFSYPSALQRIRRFRPTASWTLGEKAHEDVWELVFEAVWPRICDVTVVVSLLCENHSPYGHRWCARSVTVTRPNDTRPGAAIWTYGGEIIYGGETKEALEFKNFDSWSADN